MMLLVPEEHHMSGPPSDPQSKLIHTYIKEKHERVITFGDKSRAGRGGMAAKVKAAVYAAYAGIPVVITSGFATDNIIKVLHGHCIGTLFHRDAKQWAPSGETNACEMAVAARECSRHLQALSSEKRSKILLDIADALEANEKLIITENEADVTAAEKAGYEKSLISRLALKPGKIPSLANSIRVLAKMEEPVGHVLKRTEVITSSIPEGVGEKLIRLVTSKGEIPELLKLDDVIDLVIPRGSNELVSQIKASTKIPVLGHADGICHVYVDKSANLDMAKRIVLDAKTDYPAACNAMETLLVHKDLVKNGGLNELIVELQIKGVIVYGGPRARSLLNIPEARSFHHEYSSLACTVEMVDDVHEAIDHIHRHGSAHTDSIITEDSEVADVFLHQVDSAAVFPMQAQDSVMAFDLG